MVGESAGSAVGVAASDVVAAAAELVRTVGPSVGLKFGPWVGFDVGDGIVGGEPRPDPEPEPDPDPKPGGRCVEVGSRGVVAAGVARTIDVGPTVSPGPMMVAGSAGSAARLAVGTGVLVAEPDPAPAPAPEFAGRSVGNRGVVAAGVSWACAMTVASVSNTTRRFRACDRVSATTASTGEARPTRLRAIVDHRDIDACPGPRPRPVARAGP